MRISQVGEKIFSEHPLYRTIAISSFREQSLALKLSPFRLQHLPFHSMNTPANGTRVLLIEANGHYDRIVVLVVRVWETAFVNECQHVPLSLVSKKVQID